MAKVFISHRGADRMKAERLGEEGAGIRVLPVVLTGGEPPSILADVKFADLVADWSSGVDVICKTIGQR